MRRRVVLLLVWLAVAVFAGVKLFGHTPDLLEAMSRDVGKR